MQLSFQVQQSRLSWTVEASEDIVDGESARSQNNCLRLLCKRETPSYPKLPLAHPTCYIAAIYDDANTSVKALTRSKWRRIGPIDAEVASTHVRPVRMSVKVFL